MDMQKSVMLVSDFILGPVVIVGSLHLALGSVDDSILVIFTGVVGVLMGLALWLTLYGTARNRAWSPMVRTPCYLVLFLLGSFALGHSVITGSISSPSDFWILIGLWAVFSVNLSISISSLRRQRTRKIP